jgi:hypothetical protein
MNESIETAQACTGKTTAGQLREVIRYGVKSCYMRGHATPERESYSNAFTFTLTAIESENYKAGYIAEKKLNVPGHVSNGSTSLRKEHTSLSDSSKWTTYDEAYRPLQGFWSLSLGARERLLDVLDLLPKDAEVAFRVYLDSGTNGYLIAAECKMGYHNYPESGLHTDSLYLIVRQNVRGKEKVREFLLDWNTTAHNSARFGSPRHDRDTVGQQ